jgi:hypothetical protein
MFWIACTHIPLALWVVTFACGKGFSKIIFKIFFHIHSKTVSVCRVEIKSEGDFVVSLLHAAAKLSVYFEFN